MQAEPRVFTPPLSPKARRKPGRSAVADLLDMLELVAATLDVGLAVEYRKRNSEPVAFHHQVILFAADSPYRRWFVAPKAGRYDLVLDNEYSWFASKSVSYAVHVLRPDAVAP